MCPVVGRDYQVDAMRDPTAADGGVLSNASVWQCTGTLKIWEVCEVADVVWVERAPVCVSTGEEEEEEGDTVGVRKTC